MTGRTTVTLLVIAAALGGYYYLGELKGEARKQATKDKAELLFPYKDAEVTGFRTVRGPDTLVARRSGTGWELVRPVAADADENNVNSAVSSIVEARRQETLDGNPGSLVSFGLAPPALELTVTGPGGATRTLDVGDYNPTESFTYAKWPDSSRVMLITAATRRALDKAPAEFRDRSVMTAEATSVNRVTIHRDGRPADLVLEQSNGRWRETSPDNFRADKVTVETMIGSLGTTRVLDFVNETPTPSDLAEYGLDKPSLTLKVESGKDSAAKVLLIGKKDDKKNAWYGEREGKPTVFLLSDDNLMKSLEKEPADFRSPNVVDFEQPDVKRVVFAAGDSTWTLVKADVKDDKTGPGYTWTRKENGARFDVNKVNDLLWELKRLRYSEVVSENAGGDLAQYGLQPPARAITLYGDGDTALATVRLGHDRPGKDELFAMNGSEPVLYSVGKAAAASIPASLTDYSEIKQTASAGKGPSSPPGSN